MLPCGTAGTYKGEVYEHTRPPDAEGGRSDKPLGSFFFVVRWLIDYLGGVKQRNFCGDSAAAWRNRVTAALADAASSEDETPEEAAEAAGTAHVADSSFSSKLTKTAKRRRSSSARPSPTQDEENAEDAGTAGEMDDSQTSAASTAEAPDRAGDFSMSAFCLLLFLTQLAWKGPRANAKWCVEAGVVSERSRRLLQGLCDTFWQQPRRSQHGSSIVFIRDGDLLVSDVEVCMRGKPLGKTFGGRARVPLLEAVELLAKDALNKNLGKERRREAEKFCSRVFLAMAEGIEASRGQPIWTAVKVESLEQLRTSCQG